MILASQTRLGAPPVRMMMLMLVLLAAIISIPAAGNSAGEDPGWPRVFTDKGKTLTLYQPQVDKWTDYTTIEMRAAVSVKTSDSAKEAFGIIEAKAGSVVDNANRSVALTGMGYTLRFPGASEADAAQLEAVVRGFLPGTRTVTVSLDRVLAYVNKEESPVQKDVKVNVDPPVILHSETPAILVMFLGAPKFKPVTTGSTSLLFATNTNWDVFMTPADSKFYLLDGDNWLVSSDPKSGNWQGASALPAALGQLPNDENWSEVRKNVPGVQPKTVPAVFVSTQPAELIVTDGPPDMRPIPGTRLLQVANSPAQLFLHGATQTYYYLVAGRWFRATTLDGPWAAATFDLPPDFAAIPTTDVAGPVRASVKGTAEAEDALLLASVPQTATVSKSDAVLNVVYDGEPKFQPIPNTQVQFAVNTASQVFLVGTTYYCCADGVWFTATAPTGPWTLATEVAKEIYDIPADNPMHNVTYVQVYESAPDSVTYGYTSGYTGSYVSGGLLLYGAGMALGYALADDDDDDYYYGGYYPYPAPYYSYGMAAAYNPYTGGYYRAAGYYGPYAGAGRYAAYNPVTGTYSRGAAAYGPYGSASVRQAYNPWTDTYAGRAQVTTPNGSAGRFYAGQGDDAVWGGSRSGERGSVGWAQTSDGGKGVAWDTKRNEGAAIKTEGGDVLVGNDGNIYKREDGEWQKYDNGEWQDAGRDRVETRRSSDGGTRSGDAANRRAQVSTSDRAAQGLAGQSDRRPAAGTMESRPQASQRASSAGTRPATTSQRINSSTLSDLNRQSSARTLGDSSTRTYQNYRSSSASSQQRSIGSSTQRSSRSSGYSQSSFSSRSASGGSRSSFSGGASRSGGGGRSGGGRRR